MTSCRVRVSAKIMLRLTLRSRLEFKVRVGAKVNIRVMDGVSVGATSEEGDKGPNIYY